MSVAGILSSAALSIGSHFFQSRAQQMKQDFQQLGTDLQSGNLSAAQADFTALQNLQSGSTTSSNQAQSTIAQDIRKLSTDLQSGNTTTAQQDLTTLQKDLQSQTPTAHHHHHHHASDTAGSSSAAQLFSQLGSALQSGDLSTAQQAYSSMLQTFQQFAATSGSTAAATSSLSLNV